MVFVREEHLPITILVDGVIDRLVRFHESHAGFRALFLDANVEHRIHSVLVRFIETIIGDYFPVLDVELCKQTALVWLGISRGIMKLVEPPHHLSGPTIRAETKLALLGYLHALLVRAGVPLPADLAW